MKLLFFAQSAALAGTRALELPGRGPTTLKALLDEVPELARVRARLPEVRLAINLEIAGEDAPVRPGDEVAVLPPVSGG